MQASALLTGSGNGNCKLGAALSWNSGTTWSTTVNSANLTTTEALIKIGATDTTAPMTPSEWGSHTWVAGDFSSVTNTFRIRLNRDGSCPGSRTISVDTLQVRVLYHTADANLAGPAGEVLNVRGFWGGMNTQGSESINGDAYLAYYDTSPGTAAPACTAVTAANRACYDPNNYYNYAIYMPPSSTNGRIYIYDPVFCQVSESAGTGDR